MTVKTAYVAVGSNIHPDTHVPEALLFIKEEYLIERISTHYRTAPLSGTTKQDRYLNGVWKIRTESGADLLKKKLRNIESRFGRVRGTDSYAARTLDLDLVMLDGLIDDVLCLPDTDILVRPFLFGPLLELENELIWPLTRRPLRDMVDISQLNELQADWKMTELLKGIING